MFAVVEPDPLVTVLMPVFNGEKYLREAIESILCQTFTDFEFLIINDGSTDHTEAIVLSYKDERIRYVKNESNLKLIATLNKGLALAKGKYIVRIDADDIALPERIEKQVNYMERETDIGVAGCWMSVMKDGSEYEVRYDTDPDQIKIRMLLSCYLSHPTVIMRTDFFRKHHLNYPAAYLHAEDYALWIKVLEHGKIGMVADFLVKYRVHGDSISQQHYTIQRQMSLSLRQEQLEKLTALSAEELQLFNYFIQYTVPGYFIYPESTSFSRDNDFVLHAGFLQRLIRRNQELGIYDQSKFTAFLIEKWKSFCLEHTSLGIAVYNAFYHYGFQQYTKSSCKLRILFFVKSLLHISSWRQRTKQSNS